MRIVFMYSKNNSLHTYYYSNNTKNTKHNKILIERDHKNHHLRKSVRDYNILERTLHKKTLGQFLFV